MFPPLPTKGAPAGSAKQEIKLTPSSQSIADLVRALKPGEVFKLPTKKPSGSPENTQDNTSESEGDKEMPAVIAESPKIITEAPKIIAESPKKETKPTARSRRYTDDLSRDESSRPERKPRANRESWSHPIPAKAGPGIPSVSETSGPMSATPVKVPVVGFSYADMLKKKAEEKREEEKGKATEQEVAATSVEVPVTEDAEKIEGIEIVGEEKNGGERHQVEWAR